MHCLPDELLARIDAIDDAGGRAGSVQLAELVAALDLEHDEYEARRVRDEDAARAGARAERSQGGLGAGRRSPRR